MIHDAIIPSPAPRGGYVVRDPRDGDALAGSLQAAYRREMTLPDDLTRMIALLDDMTPRQ